MRAAILDVKTIAGQLKPLAKDLACDLLPNGRWSQDRRYWETNSLEDRPRADGGYSLKVEISSGTWRDYATGEGGDLLDLAMLRNFGGNKGDAVKWAKALLGLDGSDPAAIERVRYQVQHREESVDAELQKAAEAKTRGARAMWLSGVPIAETAASRYLEARGIAIDLLGKWPGSLRFHEEVWNSDAKVKLPCLIATMVRPDGVQVAAHRTWLARDPRTRTWVKADGGDVGVPIGNAKKVLGRCAGAFIPISKGATGKSMSALVNPEPVYVTEGIEDALSVSMARPGLRVIASYSVSNLGRIEFPPAIDTIVIVADRDTRVNSRTGEIDAVVALEKAIARQQQRGKTVKLVMPPSGVKDINAWLCAPIASGNRETAA